MTLELWFIGKQGRKIANLKKKKAKLKASTVATLSSVSEIASYYFQFDGKCCFFS